MVFLGKTPLSMFKLFDLSLLINGFPMGKARKKLATIVDVSEDKYRAFTEDAKKNIFEFLPQ